MKALFLTPPLEDPGGIQRHLKTFGLALQEILGAGNVRRISIQQQPLAPGPDSKEREAKLRFMVQAVWATVSWRPDLVICGHIALAPVGYILSKLGQARYWILLHGIEAWRHWPSWKNSTVRGAAKLIAITEFTKAQVIRVHRISAEKIAVLPCALDANLLCASAHEPSSAKLNSNGCRRILTVARLAASERYKGHDLVLRAMPSVIAQFPKVTYVVVGEGDDRPRLEKLAQELGLANNIQFTGRVTDAQLAAYYQASDIFVLPAETVLDTRHPKGEGFGIVYLEAMAFGKPVIGPKYGAPAEIIRNGEHGLLIDPQNTDELSNALVRLLSSPEEAGRMGTAAREWVRREYSYDCFREHLRQIINNRHAGSNIGAGR